MEEFTAFAVGQKFPLNMPPNMGTGVIPLVMDSSLGVVYQESNITPEEIECFRRGRLKYGVFEVNDIPFLLMDVRGSFGFDGSINILAEKEGGHPFESFLTEEANAIHLFLVEGTTGILVAMRLIGIDYRVMKRIKDACARQLARYQSAQEVNEEISRINRSYSTKEMMSLTRMQTLGEEGRQ